MKIVLETIVQRRGRTIRLVCDTEKDGFKKMVCVTLLKYLTGFLRKELRVMRGGCIEEATQLKIL